MKRFFIILILAVVTHSSSSSQFYSGFIANAKIEYERKINIYASLEGDFAEELKKRIAQYKTDYFDLEFSGSKSIYKPGKESPDRASFFSGPSSDNEVFADLEVGIYVAKKQVFDKSYLIIDSLRKVTWKLTNEIRTVAGFNCRKATAVIMDSVFIVAFYTDQIMISSGPESFGGLPGLILGLVVPRLHTTWYATKVDVQPINETHLIAPSKGKKTNYAELLKILQSSLKDWGKYGQRNIWSIMI